MPRAQNGLSVFFKSCGYYFSECKIASKAEIIFSRHCFGGKLPFPELVGALSLVVFAGMLA